MPTVTLTQFTDPNCTWSWGSEPIMRRIEALYGDQIAIEFVMGGLIEDFEEFYDASNDISEPSEVAPHWEAASRRHGMPVDADIWQEDPPTTTYPASIATKAAALQGERFGLRYLRRLREVAATERRNIERRDVLIPLADAIDIDVGQFTEAFTDGPALEAFEADLRRTREYGVRGFPTFRIEVGDDVTTLSGYRRFDQLEQALLELAPDLERRELPPVETFVNTYGYVASREVEEVYQWSPGKLEQVLNELTVRGELRSVNEGNGTFWTPTDTEYATRLGTGELALGGELEWDA